MHAYVNNSFVGHTFVGHTLEFFYKAISYIYRSRIYCLIVVKK